MTPKEHAAIWKRAAEVVGGMDTMAAEMRSLAQHTSSGYSFTSRQFSAEEMTMNKAYSAAAAVLWRIASEYEKVGELQTANTMTERR